MTGPTWLGVLADLDERIRDLEDLRAEVVRLRNRVSELSVERDTWRSRTGE